MIFIILDITTYTSPNLLSMNYYKINAFYFTVYSESCYYNIGHLVVFT